jgi:hypothetical protein
MTACRYPAVPVGGRDARHLVSWEWQSIAHAQGDAVWDATGGRGGAGRGPRCELTDLDMQGRIVPQFLRIDAPAAVRSLDHTHSRDLDPTVAPGAHAADADARKRNEDASAARDAGPAPLPRPQQHAGLPSVLRAPLAGGVPALPGPPAVLGQQPAYLHRSPEEKAVMADLVASPTTPPRIRAGLLDGTMWVSLSLQGATPHHKSLSALG